MVDADKVSSIRAKAEVLAGRSLGEQGDLLAEMAAQRACACCNRPDIPAEMEQAVAALVLSMTAGEGDVKSVTRGDTAISYFVSPSQSALDTLEPWRRLGTVKGDAQ